MARQKTTPEEIKQALKKEIIRLGIQDNSSRTVYQKKYERGVAPSPNNAIKVTGMKWQDLMIDLGFEYDGKKNTEKSLMDKISSGKRNTRGTAIDLENTVVREEYINRTISIIRHRGYTTPGELERNLKNDIDISYQTLKKSGINWNTIITAYKEKYGEPLINPRENERINWDQFSNKELLDIITKIVVDHKFRSINDYRINMTGKKIAPSIPTLNKRFGTTDPELWRMIQINGDLPIK